MSYHEIDASLRPIHVQLSLGRSRALVYGICPRYTQVLVTHLAECNNDALQLNNGVSRYIVLDQHSHVLYSFVLQFRKIIA